jgi:hypothetical protein
MEHDPGSMSRVRASRRRVLAAAALGAALALAVPIRPARAATPPASEERREARRPTAPAYPPTRMIVQWDHIVDSNDQTFEDFWWFMSYKQMHTQVWYGEFTKGVEVGGFLRDHRRSTYSAFYRWRNDFDHVLELDTEQVLKKGFVLAALVRGIYVIPENTPDDRHQILYGAGFDYYWGDYNFASFRAISDPREAGRWSFIGSTRLYFGEPNYVQPGLVQRTDGTTGWFLQGKIKLFRWSVGKYNQFDWTSVDRTIYSAGLEWTF